MSQDQAVILQAQTPLRIAVIGATGNIGQRIVQEALARGHSVTGIARHPESLASRERLTLIAGNASRPETISPLLSGHDAVVSSIHFTDSDITLLVEAVRASGAKRYLVVGGAGSLEVGPGQRVIDQPDFPALYKSEASKGVEALEYLRSVDDLDWTFLSPSAVIEPGLRTGVMRLGQDQLLVGADGTSRISMEDYAVAMLDEIETPQYVQQRFTVGY